MKFNNPPTLASVVAALGYTPVNKAGDTMLGDLKFTDDTYDIGKTGATRPRDGFFSRNLTAVTIIAGTSQMTNSGYTIGQSTGTFAAPAGGAFRFLTRGDIYSTADGIFCMTNTAGTGFTRLVLGDATSAFPAIARNGTAINFKLGDNSADAAITSSKITTSATDFLHNTSAGLADAAAAQAATLLNGPVAGNPTKWVAINDNGTTRYIPVW